MTFDSLPNITECVEIKFTEGQYFSLKKMPSTAMQKSNTSMTDKNTPLYFATDLEAQNNIGFVPATTQNEKLTGERGAP